jgi:hypothetical protein
VVGCVVGSCCNEVSVSLASRRKARRVGVWMEDDEPFGASKAVRRTRRGGGLATPLRCLSAGAASIMSTLMVFTG